MTDQKQVTPSVVNLPKPGDRLTPALDLLRSTFEQAELAVKFTGLQTAAARLNSVTDKLTDEVLRIEEALNKLNFGIWARVDGATLEKSDDGTYEHGLNLVYGKVDRKWCIAIDEFWEDLNFPDQGERETCMFKDAPREFRIKVVDKIPALLDALLKRSDEVAAEITKKTSFTANLSAALSRVSPLGSKK